MQHERALLPSAWLALRSLLWFALLPGFYAGYVPWRYFGLRDVRLDLRSPAHLLGLSLVVAGAALLATCIWEFARSGRGTLSPVDPPRELVVRGLYRYVRNPMYLSVTAIVLGEVLLTRSQGLFAYWALWFLAVNLFVFAYEEPTLRRQFGASFERYTREVGRWLPRFRRADATEKEIEMIGAHYLQDCLLQLRKLKGQAEKAIAQVEEAQLFAVLDPEANSIAVLMKHMAGNMRSRWTDFLASDGEKPDRDRDREFVIGPDDTRASVLARWEEGWERTLQTISSLAPEDLAKTVRIRGEAHSVVEAINRQMTHYAGHVGQIVLLAKHHAGPRWRSLSIPRGKSREFEVAKSGAPYDVPGTMPDAKRQS